MAMHRSDVAIVAPVSHIACIAQQFGSTGARPTDPIRIYLEES